MKLLRKLEWILFQAPNQQGQVDIILVSDTFQKTIKKDKKNVPGIIVAKISFKKSYRASQPLRTPVPSLHIWVPPSLFRGIVKNNVINSTVLYFDVSFFKKFSTYAFTTYRLFHRVSCSDQCRFCLPHGLVAHYKLYLESVSRPHLGTWRCVAGKHLELHHYCC